MRVVAHRAHAACQWSGCVRCRKMPRSAGGPAVGLRVGRLHVAAESARACGSLPEVPLQRHPWCDHHHDRGPVLGPRRRPGASPGTGRPRLRARARGHLPARRATGPSLPPSTCRCLPVAGPGAPARKGPGPPGAAGVRYARRAAGRRGHRRRGGDRRARCRRATGAPRWRQSAHGLSPSHAGPGGRPLRPGRQRRGFRRG